MASPLTRPLTRKVYDHQGRPLFVTLTDAGISFRRPRFRAAVLLPYAHGETRAQVLAAGVGTSRKPKRKR